MGICVYERTKFTDYIFFSGTQLKYHLPLLGTQFTEKRSRDCPRFFLPIPSSIIPTYTLFL